VLLGRSKVWIQGGGSHATVIPKLVTENIGIKQGDILEWIIENGELKIRKVE